MLGAVHTGEAGHSGRIFEAHSFSGHGVMHSYSAGQGLAERIVKEKYETLNLEPLSAERFALGKPIREELFI